MSAASPCAAAWLVTGREMLGGWGWNWLEDEAITMIYGLITMEKSLQKHGKTDENGDFMGFIADL